MKNRFGSKNLKLIALFAFFTFCSGFSCVRTPSPLPPSPSPVQPQSQAPVEYRNADYGFSLILPQKWRDFTTKETQWEARTVSSGNIAATGPKFSIIPPGSTPEKPRQDIPIMVFTPDQWNHIKREEWSVGAAPIAPSELGRNSGYVMALPARYNYAFPEGWQEVEQILKGKPLKTFNPKTVSKS